MQGSVSPERSEQSFASYFCFILHCWLTVHVVGLHPRVRHRIGQTTMLKVDTQAPQPLSLRDKRLLKASHPDTPSIAA